MRHEWTSKAGLGVCSVIFFTVLTNVSWAKPKQTDYLIAQQAPRPTTYYACKCTCMWKDAQGKEHFGIEDAVEFTESTLENA